MPHGGASERVQTRNNNRSQINVFFFYRICNSSNRFLQLKLQLFYVHCMFFFLSSLVPKWKQTEFAIQVETIVQIFAHVGVEPYATFRASTDEKIWFSTTIHYEQLYFIDN